MNYPLLGALRLEMRPISTYLLLLLLLLLNRKHVIMIIIIRIMIMIIRNFYGAISHWSTAKKKRKTIC